MQLKNKINSKRKNKSSNAELSRFLKIQIYALIIYVSLFLIFSLICVAADLSKDNVYYASLALFALSSFFVGFFSGVKIRKNGLISGVLHSLPMNLVFIFASLILNEFKADLRTLITFALMLAFSGIGGIVSVNIKVRK